jgi:hypothetical protein
LVNQLKQDNRSDYAYNFVFLARRLLIGVVGILMNKYDGMQLQAFLYLNMIYIIYIGRCKPLKNKLLNRIEFLQESILGMFTILHVLFTSFCPEVEIRYKLGWIYVSIFILSMGYFSLNTLYESLIIAVKYLRRFAIRCISKNKTKTNQIMNQ